MTVLYWNQNLRAVILGFYFNTVVYQNGSGLLLPKSRCHSLRNCLSDRDCTTITVRCLFRFASTIDRAPLFSVILVARVFLNRMYGTSSKSPLGISPASSEMEPTSKLHT